MCIYLQLYSVFISIYNQIIRFAAVYSEYLDLRLYNQDFYEYIQFHKIYINSY